MPWTITPTKTASAGRRSQTIAKKIGAALDKKRDCRAVRTSLKKSEALGLVRTKLTAHKKYGVYQPEKHYWLTVPTGLGKLVTDRQADGAPVTPVTRPFRLGEAGGIGLGKPTNIPTERTNEIEREESLRDSCAREARARFVRFWVQWPNFSTQPNIEYQKEAEKIFAIVCRDENDLAAILDSVHRYIEHTPTGQFRMNPARFLNEESWKYGPRGKRPGYLR